MAEEDHVVEKFLNIKFQTGSRNDLAFNGVDETRVVEILLERLQLKCVGMSKPRKENCFRAMESLESAKIFLDVIRGDDEKNSDDNFRSDGTTDD